MQAEPEVKIMLKSKYSSLVVKSDIKAGPPMVIRPR